MAKIKAIVKLQIPAGQATPAPPIGPALAQHRVNIGEFCQRFNEASKDKAGWTLPVEVTIFEGGRYEFKIKSPPTSEFLKKAAGIKKGSGQPNRNKVGKITKGQLKEIAQKKIEDLNTNNIESAMHIIKGTAKSMGLEIEK